MLVERLGYPQMQAGAITFLHKAVERSTECLIKPTLLVPRPMAESSVALFFLTSRGASIHGRRPGQ